MKNFLNTMLKKIMTLFDTMFAEVPLERKSKDEDCASDKVKDFITLAKFLDALEKDSAKSKKCKLELPPQKHRASEEDVDDVIVAVFLVAMAMIFCMYVLLEVVTKQSKRLLNRFAGLEIRLSSLEHDVKRIHEAVCPKD
jgi:hypothetical protein